MAGFILLFASPSDGLAVTFARDIAPILYQKCAPCHHSGGPTPFPMLSYSDAKRHARQIADATAKRHMPPWLPEHGYGDFENELRLTGEQIAAISRWTAAGAPQGEVSEAPPAPQFTDGWRLGTPDMVLEASRPLTVPASGPDIFWNFVLTPPVKTAHYVRAIEIRPMGSSSSIAVHHANLIIDRARSCRRLEKEPGSGFPGMDLTIERTTFDFDSHFLFLEARQPALC